MSRAEGAAAPREARPVALVLAGGDLPPAELVAPLLRGAAFVVAADGGLRHSAALGLAPDMLVGDLDSVTAEAMSAHAGVPVERHPSAKDELDLELALAAARRLGAREARVLGAFGDRLDQSLAALLVAARLATSAPPFPVSLHGGAHEAHVCAPGVPCEAGWPAGTTVSLLALAGGAVVSASGLAYPVEGLRLPFGVGLGVSNVVVGERVSLRCEAGVVAVIAEHAVAGRQPSGADATSNTTSTPGPVSRTSRSPTS